MRPLWKNMQPQKISQLKSSILAFHSCLYVLVRDGQMDGLREGRTHLLQKCEDASRKETTFSMERVRKKRTPKKQKKKKKGKNVSFIHAFDKTHEFSFFVTSKENERKENIAVMEKGVVGLG